MVSTRFAYALLVSLVAAQRTWELRRSRRNEARLREAGAVEHAPEQVAWMRVLHASWLASCVLEVFLFHRRFSLVFAILAGTLFVLGQGLRLLAMHALGGRWTVRVMVLPDAHPVRSGVFRYLRHPNYLGVIFEIAALPMIHGAWITALSFTIANGLLLRQRIRAEEAALDVRGHYARALGGLPALWPRFRGSR